MRDLCMHSIFSVIRIYGTLVDWVGGRGIGLGWVGG